MSLTRNACASFVGTHGQAKKASVLGARTNGGDDPHCFMLRTTGFLKPLKRTFMRPLKQSTRLMHAFTYEICVFPSSQININTFPPSPMAKQRAEFEKAVLELRKHGLMCSYTHGNLLSPTLSSSISRPINHLLVQVIELRSRTSFGCKNRTNVCFKRRLCRAVNELSKNIRRYV